MCVCVWLQEGALQGGHDAWLPSAAGGPVSLLPLTAAVPLNPFPPQAAAPIGLSPRLQGGEGTHMPLCDLRSPRERWGASQPPGTVLASPSCCGGCPAPAKGKQSDTEALCQPPPPPHPLPMAQGSTPPPPPKPHCTSAGWWVVGQLRR